jgi:hypothetical protein
MTCSISDSLAAPVVGLPDVVQFERSWGKDSTVDPPAGNLPRHVIGVTKAPVFGDVYGEDLALYLPSHAT